MLVSAGSDFRGEVSTNGAVVFEEGKDAGGGDVVVGVHCAVEVPEDEPILLNGAVGVGPLEVGGFAEVAADEVFVAPVVEGAEVLEPLAEAVVLGLRAEHGVGDVGAVEDAGVVWADVVVEPAELAGAVVAGGGGDGEDCG